MKDNIRSYVHRRKQTIWIKSWAKVNLHDLQTTRIHASLLFCYERAMRLNLFKKGADVKYYSTEIQMYL